MHVEIGEERRALGGAVPVRAQIDRAGSVRLHDQRDQSFTRPEISDEDGAVVERLLGFIERRMPGEDSCSFACPVTRSDTVAQLRFVPMFERRVIAGETQSTELGEISRRLRIRRGPRHRRMARDTARPLGPVERDPRVASPECGRDPLLRQSLTVHGGARLQVHGPEERLPLRQFFKSDRCLSHDASIVAQNGRGLRTHFSRDDPACNGDITRNTSSMQYGSSGSFPTAPHADALSHKPQVAGVLP
ncbi:hypothetical protein ACX9R5_09395 [Rathayibacter sp. CAU 1779]